MRKVHYYHAHPSYDDPDFVRELLDFQLSSDDYDPGYKATEGMIEIYKEYPILRPASLHKLFLKFNLLKKLALDDDDFKQEADSVKTLLVNHNLRLIHYALKKYPDREEYLTTGYLAMHKAVDNFNPNLGFAFATYSTVTILRQCIRMKDCDNSAKSLENLTEFNVPGYLDRKEDLIDTKADFEHILSVLSTISSDVELDVLKRSFGICGYDQQKLAEIGKIYNLSRERIRQIRDKSLKRLRVRFAKQASVTECI